MKKLILSLLLLSIYSYALADEIVTLKSGEKAILLDSGRWSIMAPREKKPAETYQGIKAIDLKPEKKAAETYQEIELINLKQDVNAFEGKQIKIQTLAEMYNFILILRQDEMDATPLTVNINRLSHEDKIHLQAACDNGCTVTVYGRVGDVLHDEKGIIADKVEW